jgi:hypothetical protein
LKQQHRQMGIAAENAKRGLTTDYTDHTDKKWMLGWKNWRKNVGCSALIAACL